MRTSAIIVSALRFWQALRSYVTGHGRDVLVAFSGDVALNGGEPLTEASARTATRGSKLTSRYLYPSSGGSCSLAHLLSWPRVSHSSHLPQRRRALRDNKIHTSPQ
jgi:hypothetical protein